MNAYHLHVAYVTAHPEDRASARALVDHFQEAFNEDHVTALKVVARIRRDQRKARELGEAAARMERGAAGRGLLMISILGAAGAGGFSHCNTVLVYGSRGPELRPRGEPYHDGYLHFPLITVGSRWVIRRSDELRADEADDANAMAEERAARKPE